jgi:hypothetical protein
MTVSVQLLWPPPEQHQALCSELRKKHPDGDKSLLE